LALSHAVALVVALVHAALPQLTWAVIADRARDRRRDRRCGRSPQGLPVVVFAGDKRRKHEGKRKKGIEKRRFLFHGGRPVVCGF